MSMTSCGFAAPRGQEHLTELHLDDNRHGMDHAIKPHLITSMAPLSGCKELRTLYMSLCNMDHFTDEDLQKLLELVKNTGIQTIRLYNCGNKVNSFEFACRLLAETDIEQILINIIGISPHNPAVIPIMRDSTTQLYIHKGFGWHYNPDQRELGCKTGLGRFEHTFQDGLKASLKVPNWDDSIHTMILSHNVSTIPTNLGHAR